MLTGFSLKAFSVYMSMITWYALNVCKFRVDAQLHLTTECHIVPSSSWICCAVDLFEVYLNLINTGRYRRFYIIYILQESRENTIVLLQVKNGDNSTIPLIIDRKNCISRSLSSEMKFAQVLTHVQHDLLIIRALQHDMTSSTVTMETKIP